jgi:ER membrane protein complex subunit 1
VGGPLILVFSETFVQFKFIANGSYALHSYVSFQSFVTHSHKVEALRGIVSIPAKLESTTLIFTYGVDLFYTRLAPSRTYDSLTDEFSYALLLITIAVLVGAIIVTWIWSEKKELRDKWR